MAFASFQSVVLVAETVERFAFTPRDAAPAFFCAPLRGGGGPASWPPSTTSTEPVINDARSLATNAITSAASSAVPICNRRPRRALAATRE